MTGAFTISTYTHIPYLDMDSLELPCEHLQWICRAFSEITGLLLIEGATLRKHDQHISNRAIELMIEARLRDPSLVLTRTLFSIVGRFYHELAHYYDLTRTYLGYELFLYGSRMLVDAANVISHASFYELDPMMFYRLVRQGQYKAIVRDKSVDYLDRFNRHHAITLETNDAVNANFTQPRNTRFLYADSSILEFSALIREIGAILYLFGKYAFEMYVEEVSALYNDSKAIKLWNEFLFCTQERKLVMTSQAFLEALEGCSLLINLSCNGTTSVQAELSQGPSYSECFYTYFYDWLSGRELNRESCLTAVKDINSAVGYLGPHDIYPYLSAYVMEHFPKVIYDEGVDEFWGGVGDYHVPKRIISHYNGTKQNYVEIFKNYERRVWSLLSVDKFVKWPEVEWIPAVFKYKDSVFLTRHGGVDIKRAKEVLDIFELSLLSNFILFDERTSYSAFYREVDELRKEHGIEESSPLSNPFF